MQGLLDESGRPADEVIRRLRLLRQAKRKVEPQFFAEVARALLNRQQLTLTALHRGRNESITRILSLQRVVQAADQIDLKEKITKT